MTDHSSAGRVLLTGATGYIGGRLLPVLEESGRPVRCLARPPEGLAGLAYWYALYPLHALVFRGMLRGITEAVEVSSASPVDPEDP